MIIRNLAFACLVALMMAFAPLQGHAQQAATSNIAVIEYERLIQSSLAHQSIQQQLIALHDQIQGSIDADEAKLVEMDRELAMQQSILAPEAYEEKLRQFEERVAAVRDRVNGLNERIEKARGNATGQIQQAVFVIISELAEQRGYVAVLPTSTMVYAAPSMNITAEVQQQLDARLPRVEVQFSEQ
jgi:outer membrane protein